ncbi:hypothetical protein CSB45_02425 [candidate division KSB3 bacterium]|uniref:Uncharacterized protein n=1 Tax=candidate division KSB3 bacterium TaxID=2044937 RepID=A0A2G6E9X4_9BACT|nr:MAG: hypothetical protein CSB45_02425 [candidate division KSB3 bacterium]PIE30936.1 MAG: hypothetical protein CSA57_01035 [candidate division KSB3 bacterium]
MVLQYDSFRDDDSPKHTGFQTAVPLQWDYERGALAVTLDTTYAHTELSREGDDDFALSGFTDTFINAIYSYTLPTQNPIRFVMDFAVNLPTGKAHLDNDDLSAERILQRDHFQQNDLFRVDILDEGLNLGATLGLERESGIHSVGVYSGYVYYGQYDLCWDEVLNEYDPGDEILLHAAYSWKKSPRRHIHAYLGYSHFGIDTENDADTLQIGDKLSAGADLQIAVLDTVDMTLSLQYITQFTSEESIGGKMIEESENSIGSELFGALKLLYHATPRFSIPFVADLRYYGESERKRRDLDLPYEGRRVRYAGGAGFHYRLTPSIALLGQGLFVHLDCDPNTESAEQRIYEGVNLDLCINYTF